MEEQLLKILLTKAGTTGGEVTRVVACLCEDLLSDRKRRAAVWQELIHGVRLTFSVLREIAVAGGSEDLLLPFSYSDISWLSAAQTLLNSSVGDPDSNISSV